MEIHDFWSDLSSIFAGNDENIKEIDLVNLKAGSMAECLYYLFSRAKDCTCQVVLFGTETKVSLQSPDAVVNHLLQGQISLVMWLSLPALPALSVFIDYNDAISFGFVQGTWDAMAVLAFFDLLYELKHMSPNSDIRPNAYTFSPSERIKITKFWQDYDHATS
ncbi:MAG: hypothetical protein Phog2KO_05420 [Phototrophicaceae bacterium]